MSPTPPIAPLSQPITATYSIRRPGCSSWAEGVSFSELTKELMAANQVQPGHMAYRDGEQRIDRGAVSYMLFNGQLTKV